MFKLLLLLFTLNVNPSEIEENTPLMYTIKHKSGYIMETGMMFNGERDGLWKQYYKNGNLKTIAIFNLGEKDGLWKHYNCKGELILTVNYKNDIVISYNKIK